MTGKPPHVPAGKARSDESHRREITQSPGDAFPPSGAEIARLNEDARRGHPAASKENPRGGVRERLGTGEG